MSSMSPVNLAKIVNFSLCHSGLIFDRKSAIRMLVAIALQESALLHRVQVGGGPALSWWQIEPVAIKQVQMSKRYKQVLTAFGYYMPPFPLPDVKEIHEAITHNDLLAASIARLILLFDRKPLPSFDAPPEDGWDTYLYNWKPGKPRLKEWSSNWETAKAAVNESGIFS